MKNSAKHKGRSIKRIRGTAAILVSLGALATPAHSIGKTLNLATRSDPTGTYNIAFCARTSPGVSGKPGHAFVSFSHKDTAGNRDFLAIGHTVAAGTTPGSAAWSYFGAPVSGVLK